MSPHQQPVGVHPKGRTGHQRHQVLSVLDLQQRCVRRQYRGDLIHLVGQHLTQYMDVKSVALRKLVNVRKQLRTGHPTVGRQHRMGAAASHRQGSPHHMPHGPFQRFRPRAVPHREIHADFWDVNIAHGPAHGELLRIEHGRGRSPSRTDCRLASQHGVIHLRRPPLVGQLCVIGTRNCRSIDRLHIRMIPFTHQLTQQRIEQQPQCKKHTGHRQQSPLHWSFLLCFRPRTTINAATPSSIQPPTVNIQVP